MTTEQEVSECEECGAPGRTWPTPFDRKLCAHCWEQWFVDEHETPIEPKWVLQCPCQEVVKGTGVEAQCSCGRVYVCYQLY